jgi:hypothetical protein
MIDIHIDPLFLYSFEAMREKSLPKQRAIAVAELAGFLRTKAIDDKG